MEIFTVNNLSFRFPEMKEAVLKDISFHVQEGEFIVLCGPSGCGKTTLLRLLKSQLAPVGECEGVINYNGKQMDQWSDRKLIEEIGYLFQDPENQIVMDEVMQEIVFGLENLGYSNFEMRKRVAELVHFFGMELLLRSKSSALSGGQKQLLNLLSVLLLKPKVLLLDEPTSQLDPVAAKELLVMLERLNKEMGMTIILVEHRLEELFAVADRIFVMDTGEIVYEGTSTEVTHAIYENNDELFISYLPSVSQLYMSMNPSNGQHPIPLSVKDCRSWIGSLQVELPEDRSEKVERPSVGETVLALKDLYFQYDKKGPLILKNLRLDIKKGDYFALVGGNGSGKTTLLKACIGMVKPQRGTARLFGKEVSKLKGKELYENIAYLPQNPRTFFIQDTIEKELQEVATRHQLGPEKVEKMLTTFGISHLRSRHPYDCSGGEMQKAALACMLLGHPEILFIDEPTKGLDPVSKKELAHILKKFHQQGLTIVMVTHDIEFAVKHVSRCAMMFDGAMTVDGAPEDLFKGNYFYTTSINRATRETQVPEVLTIKEALSRWPVPVVTC